jgi:hypothetical protein
VLQGTSMMANTWNVAYVTKHVWNAMAVHSSSAPSAHRIELSLILSAVVPKGSLMEMELAYVTIYR